MKRRLDMSVAFLVAISLHGLGSICAERLLATRRCSVMPEFKGGESSVALTLLPAARPKPVPPPEPREPPEVQQELPDNILADVKLPESEPIQEMIPPPDEEPLPPPAEEERVVPPVIEEEPAPELVESHVDNDSDASQKGVIASYVAETEIRPRYPLGSRIRGEEGVVTLNITVNARGRATSVQITRSSGYASLDRAAVTAARRARFSTTSDTATQGGEAVLSFKFKLVD